MRRARMVSTALVLLMGAALAGCTASPSATDLGTTSGGSGSIEQPAPELGDQGIVDPSRSDSESDPAAGQDSTTRDVITTAQLDLVVDDPVEASSEARDLVEAAGGRIDSSSRQPASEYQPASASIVARIPAAALDDTIDDLSDLGDVRSLSTQANDVTSQTTDLDARIDSLTGAVQRLRQLLSSAATTADLIAIETALSEREAELESLTAQRAYLGDQVDYSTVSVSFTTPDQTAPAGPRDFWGAIGYGFAALVSSLGSAVIAFGLALPWLVAIALVVALVIGVLRLVRRLRRPRSAASPSAPAGSAPASPSATAYPSEADGSPTPPPAPGASSGD